LQSGARVLAITTSAKLFRDAEGVAAEFAKRLDDFERLRGRIIDGTELIAADQFDLSDLASEAWGVRARLRLESSDVDFVETFAAFRLDRLLGDVSILRIDDDDMSAPTEQIARDLEARVRAALLQEVDAAPPREYLVTALATARQLDVASAELDTALLASIQGRVSAQRLQEAQAELL